MNSTAYATYKQYLNVTNDVGAAANLTLADANQTLADVMQRSLDAQAAPVPATAAVLTVKEAAARLGISPGTVYDLTESGQLRCQRFGKGRGTIRIRTADLDEYTGKVRPPLRSGRSAPAKPCQPAGLPSGGTRMASGLVRR